MARYNADHKSKTRERLLETARGEFRRHGFDNVSIDTLMRAAGMTRGGFYAHFASKEALVREVLRLEPGLVQQLRAAADEAAAPQRAAGCVDAYLADRDDLVQCPLVAHPMDAHRGGPQRATLYGDQISNLIGALAAVMRRDATLAEADVQREADLAALLVVGAAVVTCAIPDAALADRLATVARTEIRKRLGGDTPPASDDGSL